jgi:hypothetical protein
MVLEEKTFGALTRTGMMGWLHTVVADVYNQGSFATRLRKKRIFFFENLLRRVQPPVRILDVGGTEIFWQMVGGCNRDIQITLLNLTEQPVSQANFTSVMGDARSLTQFADAEFDVVFSNSVIEHLGAYENQRRMADEVKRVGKRYFIQTPNRNFPIEPHFEFPFFQFMPIRVSAWIASHFALGWYGKFPSYEAAKKEIASIHLLSKRELERLFSEATICEEKLGGITISLIAYYGWETT